MTESEILEALESEREFLGLEEDFEIKLGPESTWLLNLLGLIPENDG